MNKKILLILLLAFFIRLIALNQSLWLDEGTTAKVIQNYSYIDIVKKFLPNDFHPPLYYLFMKLWTNIFGYSEIALRFPSIIFSLLTGWIIYRISRFRSDQHNYSEAEWTAAFFLFNPLIIYYSQEARMYLMTTLFICTSLYFFLFLRHAELVSASIIRSRNKFGMTKALIMMCLFMILAFATFYGSIFFIAAILIYLLWKKNYKIFIISCFTLFVTLLILSPLLLQQLTNAKQSLQIVANWSLVLGKANLKNLLLIPMKFTIGRISWEPKLTYYFISGLWLLVTGYGVIKGGLKNKLLLFLLICPLIFGFLISFNTPLLQYFRFIYLIPIMSILLVLGIKRSMIRIIVLSGFIFFSLIYLLNAGFHREDWKSLANSLPENTPVYAIVSSMDALKYYNKKLFINELTPLRPAQRDYEGRSGSLVNELKNTREIIIIPYTSEIYGLNYQEMLKEKKYTLKETKSFRGLTAEYWQSVLVN